MRSRTAFRSALVALGVCAVATAQTPAATLPKQDPALEARAADRRRMLDLLDVREPTLPTPENDPARPANIRPDPALPGRWTDGLPGHIYTRSGWGRWSNYNPAKADVGTLPDPLVLKNGKRVTDAATWWSQRRPEIVADFESEIYGWIPASTPKVTWAVVETNPTAVGGTARMKRLVGHIDHAKFPTATPELNVTLYLPVTATKPVPVIVVLGGLEFGSPPSGPGPKGPNAMELLLAKGWGYAKFDPKSVQADSGAGLTRGIIGLVNAGQPRQPDDWGSLAAISWGLSRTMDYLETDHDVDATRVGLQGMSRWGKATLVALAFEPRWAIGFVACSGEGGAKLHRRDFGETVDNICGPSGYHWMAGNFLKYAGRWDALPVDQHELIALVAPRPIFVSAGTKDLWADPVGMFKACVGAGPVYRLLGQRDLGQTEMPAPDAELISGDIGFRCHEGGHLDSIDWPAFLKFADQYFSHPPSPRS